MKLVGLANRNLRQRALSSLLTTASIMLGTAIVAFLWIAADQAEKKYRASGKGYDVVVGPSEHSSLDLVLATVFLLKPLQGVIPLKVYKDLHDRRKWGRFLRAAVPVAFGDNYKGFPIIATTDEWFHVWGKKRPDTAKFRPPHLRFAEGGPWSFSHDDLIAEAKHQVHMKTEHNHEGHDHGHAHFIPENWKEVVIGAQVAKQLGLSVGDSIIPAHGEGDLHHHDEAECEVVGVLEELGTPIDRAIYLPLGVHYRLEGHDEVGAKVKIETEDDISISAVVMNHRMAVGNQTVRAEFQRRTDGIAALPSVEIRTLFNLVGNIARALRAVSWIVLIVASLGVFIALYNTMNDRRRDVAIMRSLGARRSQIFGIVLLEALLITGVGAILGVLLAHGSVFILADWLREKTSVAMSGAAFVIEELWLILGVTVLGAFAGWLPAHRASRTDVAEYLSPDR